nr:hypothetical protein [Succinivibrio sp.]
MKYVFTDNTTEAQNAEDAVLELEYNDLLTNLGEYSFKTTKDLTPRSFSKLQLRARNALKSLLNNPLSKVMLLCGSTSVDTIDIACDLFKDVASITPTIAIAPTKFELFGSERESGVLTEPGFLVMPCSHFIDHPKWLGMADACIAMNEGLKLVLCGDATDCATLNMMWQTLDNAVR